MEIIRIRICVLFVFLGGSIALPADNQNCTIISDSSGSFSDKLIAANEERCWMFEVPSDGRITLNIKLLFPRSQHRNGLEIINVGTGRNVTYIKQSTNINLRIAGSNVKVVHFVRDGATYYPSELTVEYKIVRGILAMDEIEEPLKNAVSWLKNQRTLFWGWKEETPRAVVALYLADAMNFSGSDLKEELVAKETDVRTSISLLRNYLTNSELSMIINALLVTCHNPHHFYGNNLVRRLKTSVESAHNFTHPIAYLALCNANETWPAKAFGELNNALNRRFDYQFIKDYQAMAVMALSCMANRGMNLTNRFKTSIVYEGAIKRFKDNQLEDGSFGNAHSTALVMQALIASGQESVKDWNMKAAVKYLISAVGSASVDFLTTYLTLPVLNAKSLVDISKINCSGNIRKYGDDTVSDIHDSLGLKMNVKYSLYFGENKDIIHTISLKVPVNLTAHDIMEIAAQQDPKYKFEETSIFGKKYIYKIAHLANDPEHGKFWLQYLWTSKLTMEIVTKDPDELVMKDGQHMIMWYKVIII